MTRVSPPAVSPLQRLLYRLLAYASFGTGLAGIVLPGLPTTEFMLLAAWAASKSSPAFHQWLLRHRLFGPMLANWREHGAVSRRTKILATVSMSVCLLLMFFWLPHPWLLWPAALGMAAGALWLWSRPGVGEPARSDNRNEVTEDARTIAGNQPGDTQ